METVVSVKLHAHSELNAATRNDNPYMPVTEVICTNAAFAEAGYPSKFQGKPISGKRSRINSKATHRKGAATNAFAILWRDTCCTSIANEPDNIPHDAAISSNRAHPPARETPP